MALYTKSSLFLSSDDDDDNAHLNHNQHHNTASSADNSHEATISQLNHDLKSLQIQLDTSDWPPTTTDNEEDLILLDHRQLLEIQILSIQEELARLNMGSMGSMGSALSPPVVISDDEEGEQNTHDHLARPIMISQASGPPDSTSTKKRKLDQRLDSDPNNTQDNKSRKTHIPEASSSATSTGLSSSTSKTSMEESDFEYAKRLDAEWNSIGNGEWMYSEPSTSRDHPRYDEVDLTGLDDDEDIEEIIRSIPPQVKHEPLSYAPGRYIQPNALPSFGLDHQPLQFTDSNIDDGPYPWMSPPIDPLRSWQDWLDEEMDGMANAAYEDPQNWWDTVNYSKKRLHPIFGNRRMFEETIVNEKEAIHELLQEIKPENEPEPEGREPTPPEMKVQLMEHQKIGLGWLKSQEDGRAKGGILADDMGLGKTIQALALIVSRPSTDSKRKTTLIVAPVALLRQWKLEIEQKIKPEHRLSVYLHHGPCKRLKTFKDMSKHDVVLTSYGTLGSEFRRKTEWEQRNTEYPENRPKDTDFPFLGDKSLWYRVILDEAQYIKNHNTLSSRACAELHSTHRLCLSGTPIQNSAYEFYSLLRFLRYRPYNDHKLFQKDIGKGLKSKQNHEHQASLQRLQTVIKLILLRRMKTSTIDGKPILTLPLKHVELVHAVFSEDERQFYDALAARAVLQFNKYLRAGTAMKNYSQILVLLLRLRQATCHPHLIKDMEKGADLEAEGGQLIKNLLSEFSDDTVTRVREVGGVFDCPVCYDVTENPKLVVNCGHELCSECLVRVINRHVIEAGARGDEGGAAKCPQCRGPLHAERIVDYATFREHFFPDVVNDEILGVEDLPIIKDVEKGDSDDEENSESDLDDSDDETDDLDGFIVSDDRVSFADSDSDEFLDDDGTEDFQKLLGPSRSRPSSSRTDNKSDAKVSTNLNKGVKTSKKVKERDKAPKKSKKARGKEKRSRKRPKTMAQKRSKAFQSKKGKEKYMKKISKSWESSAKIDKCLEILDSIRESDPKEKTIIFSLWTSMLDLVEVPLLQRGINYTRYDGSMSANERNEAVLDFQDESKDISVMLISLKAGNAGLNLVSASQVIILDPFWNGSVEDQAIDRAHRIGQTKEVHVHRIVVENTVEDRILELQRQKRELVESALDENAAKAISRLGQQELSYLFGVHSLTGQAPAPPMRRVAGQDV